MVYNAVVDVARVLFTFWSCVRGKFKTIVALLGGAVQVQLGFKPLGFSA